MYFSIVSIIVVFPLGIYFYFYLKRICAFLKINVHSKIMKTIIILCDILFVLPAINIWGIGAVIVFHFFAFALLFELFHWLVVKKTKAKKAFEKIYQMGFIPIICTCLVLGYGYWNMHQVLLTNYTMTTQKNIDQNYRIAFLSDLHFGNTMNQQQLERYCLEISSQNPDIVILGGDIVDEKTSHQQMKEAFETLGQIENKYGIYYVYGNHDQATYSKSPPFTSKELNQTITNNHITILADSTLTIQNDVTLIGRLDRSQLNHARKDSMQLKKDVPQDTFLIIVDHQPVDLEVNNDLCYDLQLSGHTHAGQIFPVGLVSGILGFGEMNYGYRQMQHMQVIVSSGIAGWGYPLRTGSHSEYVIIDIMKNH